MKKKGFTLIELIIVIAIIAILAAIAFVSVNPGKRIGDANDNQRWADVVAIADAWQKHTVDQGTSAATVTSTTIYAIDASTGGIWSVDSCADAATEDIVDLTLLVTNGYLSEIPNDPLGADGAYSGYYFFQDNNIITIGSCDPYSDGVIVVSR